LTLRPCRYCQQSFQPSKFRPDQSACSQRDCQRRRRSDYHRSKIKTDSVYAEVVRDSQRKWCESQPDYQQRYRQSHAASVEQNRRRQQHRDQKRRLHDLEKNNLALDLKRSDLEVWLVGSAAGHLEKNNLASSKLFIFKPLGLAPGARAGS